MNKENSELSGIETKRDDLIKEIQFLYTIVNTENKLGRNSMCFCGSGKKYKKCHLSEHEEKEFKLNELCVNLNEVTKEYINLRKESKNG